MKQYLPWAILIGIMALLFCPYFKGEEEITSGEKSLKAVKRAIKKMR